MREKGHVNAGTGSIKIAVKIHNCCVYGNSN
uniref:Uncharacterized protein n=1 Tax=Anguilla anguilla TaxID=7936 RepID=A0A0E9PIF2_ANGAN